MEERSGLEKDVLILWTDNSSEAKELKDGIVEKGYDKVNKIFTGAIEPSAFYKGVFYSGYNNIRMGLCLG